MEQTIHASAISGRLPRRQLIIGAAGLLILVGIVASWLFEIHAVRLKELKYRLKSATDQNTSVRTLSLVSRFRLLIHQRNVASEAAGNNREARVMQILADTAYSTQSDNLSPDSAPCQKDHRFLQLDVRRPRF